MTAQLPDALLETLSARVASQTGLHFPRERWRDLSSSMEAAALEHGQRDVAGYVRELLASPLGRAQIDTLARHLTVGETYFFREQQSFEALEQRVLPELIARRSLADKKMRIWSAGCCTGEEPYSIAILLDRLLPDPSEWRITILGTDINPRFLETASAGSFGEWSFRSIPAGIRDGYFSAMPGGRMQITGRVHGMVTFSVLNLAEDTYPSLVNNTTGMDLVVCRNVLMYFTRPKVVRAVDNFFRALLPEGWLLVAPCEASHALFQSFRTVEFPGATFFRKPAECLERQPFAEDNGGHQDPAPALPLRALSSPAPDPRQAFPADQARALANQGRLAEADQVCRRAISADPLDASYRFLHAMVAQERGMLDDAVQSLTRALYLDKDFVMAHFALAGVGKRLGRTTLSLRHYRIALGLLEALDPALPLLDSDGLSAERLAQLIRSALGEGRGEA
jgi:chemotaxis protein methyltransferase CheR